MNNNPRLKFRYYDSSLKRMVYSTEWSHLAIFFEWASKYAHEGVIQQFTGIQDKNGKDIYEGDFIQGLHDFGPGGFHQKSTMVFWNNQYAYQWNYWLIHTLEITGNVFQNQPLPPIINHPDA